MDIIPPFKLELIPLNDDARNLQKFEYADPIIGTRHKIGGEPDYLQEKENLNCPDCGKKMTFYAQLDSINDQFCIADCGMIYVFICFDCCETKAIIQSY
jgi:hypothetical protein